MGLKSAVYNQERFQIKSGLWWRMYGNWNFPSIFYLLTIFKTLQVGYDNTLLNRFGGSASQKIWDALTHTWATFQLSSLGTTITIHVHSWYHINTNLFASNYHLSKMYQTTRNYLQGKMSWVFDWNWNFPKLFWPSMRTIYLNIKRPIFETEFFFNLLLKLSQI